MGVPRGKYHFRGRCCIFALGGARQFELSPNCCGQSTLSAPRGRSNRIGALLVINQDAGNAQLGGTRLVLPTLTAHLNVPRPFNEDLVLTSSASTNGGRTFGRVE